VAVDRADLGLPLGEHDEELSDDERLIREKPPHW